MSAPRRRGWWRGVALAAAAVALLLAPCERDESSGPGPDRGEQDGGDLPAAGEAIAAEVIEVVDGDTIVVALPDGDPESVRYIGIDTPESNPDQPLECFGHEAEAENARLVGGREVSLELGPEARDHYGRLLAFVRVPAPAGAPGEGGRGLLVNAELVRGGFARSLTIAPNDALAPLFERLEADAGRAGRGLWGACNT